MNTDIEVDEREELIASLQDKERRHRLSSSFIKRGLAEQIREMRDERGWTQSELARASDKVQETISQLENPNYGNYTIKTLERLAKAFDVALFVRFGPFSELVDHIVNISPEDLAVPSFANDPGLNSRVLTLTPTASASRIHYVSHNNYTTSRPYLDKLTGVSPTVIQWAEITTTKATRTTAPMILADTTYQIYQRSA